MTSVRNLKAVDPSALPPLSLVRDAESRASHQLQFYDDGEALGDALAEFVASGLAHGEPVLILATHAQRAALAQRLEVRAFDVELACMTGQLTILDAHDTLGAFVVDGMPEVTRFNERLGGLLTKAASRFPEKRIRVYGEMVDVLCRDGKAEAAVRLEELWNGLARTHNFSLLCAYAVDNFHEENVVLPFEHRRLELTNGSSPSPEADDDAEPRSRLAEREVRTLRSRVEALEFEVSRRKALEVSLRSALRRIGDSERTFRDFAQNGIEGLHWIGADGVILWANKAEMNMLGYSAQEYIGRHYGEFQEQFDRTSDIVPRLMNGETLRDYEVRLRCKDGTVKDVLLNANVYRRDGRFVHARCFTRDITERKEVEAELRSKKEELETTVEQFNAVVGELEIANRTKDDFLCTVSHELRTPLNAILGWVRMMRGGRLPDEKRERALETIERNANVQAQLIENLLDVSGIISGRLRLDVDVVEIGTIASDAADAVRSAANAKGVGLKVVIDPATPTLVGDADRLRQIVWNLLTNAVKFTPSGGAIELKAGARDDSAIEVVVSDTGQGIHAGFLPHVFERFRQADATSSRKFGGLGLGLAIVRHLTELHGGTVEVASEGLGRGSQFTVTLPISTLRPTSYDSPPALRLPMNGVRSEISLDGIHLLVVDDEPDARELLAQMLTSYKASVSTAAGVEEALRIVEELRPDVVISDIGMPGEDGYSLIRKLRALPNHELGRTPAVALTAYCRIEDRMKALVAGFNIHVPKPVEPTELVAAVASLITVFPRREETSQTSES